jgi:hypothetical protein
MADITKSTSRHPSRYHIVSVAAIWRCYFVAAGSPADSRGYFRRETYILIFEEDCWSEIWDLFRRVCMIIRDRYSAPVIRVESWDISYMDVVAASTRDISYCIACKACHTTFGWGLQHALVYDQQSGMGTSASLSTIESKTTAYVSTPLCQQPLCQQRISRTDNASHQLSVSWLL